MPRRILENAAGALMPQGLAGFLDDPVLLHSLGEIFRIFLLQLELAVQDHQLVEAALAVGESQIIAIALEDVTGAGHHGGSAGPLTDIAAATSRIAMQRSANTSGDADQWLEPRQSFAHGDGNEMPELGAAAGRDFASFYSDAAKGSFCEADDHAWHALVAHEHI